MAFMTSGNKDRKSHKDIIIDYMGKILDLGLKEFRGGYEKLVIHPSHTEKLYVEDGRKVFIQAVQIYADCLCPFFDKIMITKEEDINSKLKKLKEKYLEKNNVSSRDEKKFYDDKLDLMKTMFRELCKLLHRIDYLKTQAYAEHASDFGLGNYDDEGDDDKVVDIDS